MNKSDQSDMSKSMDADEEVMLPTSGRRKRWVSESSALPPRPQSLDDNTESITASFSSLLSGIRRRTQSMVLNSEQVRNPEFENMRRCHEENKRLTGSLQNITEVEQRVTEPEKCNFSESFSSEDSNPAIREVSQTDHLNKRLLGSFLTRINNMAANIMDPTGTRESLGEVYTDDVLMDRILRRMDSYDDGK